MCLEHQDLGFGAVGKVLGERWKQMSDAEKAPYASMAEEDKARHASEMAVYTPAPVVAAGTGKGGRGKKDPNAPKRAISGYACFVREERPKLTAEQPGLAFGDGGKILGQRWKELSEEQKAPYMRMAEEDKLRHAKEMEAYASANQ